MSSAPLQVARVSSLLQGSLLMGTMQSSQVSLLKVQQQLSTGQRLTLPSEDTAAALGIVSLKRQLADNKTYASSLTTVDGFLKQAGSTLSSVSSLITDAKSVALSQVGVDATADSRAAQADYVDSLISNALNLANTKYQGQSLFAGQAVTADAFTSVGGGYKYQGTTAGQSVLSPTGQSLQYTLSGDQAFGAVSSQVVGYKNLAPSLAPSTRLSDLNGATLKGVTTGPLSFAVGVTTGTVDLSNAATVGDVTAAINSALAAAGSTATVSLAGGALAINGDATQPLTFSNTGSGTTASDLGLAGTYLAAATTTAQNLSPRITATTSLFALNNGAGIDPTGFTISNGATSAVITTAGISTVGDLLNRINNSGTNVQAQINADGTGINLFNPLSGTSLRISENGGTTADDLGIRSFTGLTNLTDLNAGIGVTPIANTLPGPTGLLAVTTTSGSTFNVRVDGVNSPSALIAAINAATGNTSVTAAINSTGNGITLTDTSGGTGNLSVAAGTGFNANGSDLGIVGKTGTGATLAGTNIALSTDDFRVTRKDGTSFTVSLKGALTVNDVLSRINNADGNTTAATKVTAALNTVGNGISLTDASTGAGLLTVTSLNASSAPSQLGILKTASASTPGVINGDDNNPIQPQGLFTSLTMLRDALRSNDTAGISRAAQLLDLDFSRVNRANGVVGARDKDVLNRQSDADDQKTQLSQALSLLNDTDFTEAATRFQMLNTAYSASLQVAQSTRNTSLLDFLK